MAAPGVDRASQRHMLGGGMRAPHGACALDAQPVRSIFRFAFSPCILQDAAWSALASDEVSDELDWQLKVFKAALAPTFVVAGRSRRRENMTGIVLRLLAAALPVDHVVVFRCSVRTLLCPLDHVRDLYVRSRMGLSNVCYKHMLEHHFCRLFGSYKASRGRDP